MLARGPSGSARNLSSILIHGVQTDEDGDEEDQVNVEFTKEQPLYRMQFREPSLIEVMEHDDFLDELTGGNNNLQRYLNPERLLKMVDFLIIEPQFEDNPSRCFKLPMLACETLSSNVPCVEEALFNWSSPSEPKITLWDAILSYFSTEDPYRSKNFDGMLNPTMGAYINTVVTFWLYKRHKEMLQVIMQKKDFVTALFNHLYLTECVTDLLIRLCCLPQVFTHVNLEDYNKFRASIIQQCINQLDCYSENDLITEQLFAIFTGICQKCYVMVQPRRFFEVMLSPFNFLPLLEFTTEGGTKTKQGSRMLKIFFYNLFSAIPEKAIQIVDEFELPTELSSPKRVEPQYDDGEIQPEEEKKVPQEIDPFQTTPGNDSYGTSQNSYVGATMKENQTRRLSIVGGKVCVFQRHELSTLTAQQILTVLHKFELLLIKSQKQTTLLTRICLYELLSVIIQLDHKLINSKVSERAQLLESIITDIERFDSTSTILVVLNKLIRNIVKQTSVPELAEKLLIDHGLLQRMTLRLSLSEYSKQANQRKDIYAFIHLLSSKLKKYQYSNQDSRRIKIRANLIVILKKAEPYWTALSQAQQNEEARRLLSWGAEVPSKSYETFSAAVNDNIVHARSIVRRHPDAQSPNQEVLIQHSSLDKYRQQ